MFHFEFRDLRDNIMLNIFFNCSFEKIVSVYSNWGNKKHNSHNQRDPIPTGQRKLSHTGNGSG